MIQIFVVLLSYQTNNNTMTQTKRLSQNAKFLKENGIINSEEYQIKIDRINFLKNQSQTYTIRA